MIQVDHPRNSSWEAKRVDFWRSEDGFAGSIGLEMGFLEYQKIGRILI
jgi:hypothetical protein